jgi:hypothetical protein
MRLVIEPQDFKQLSKATQEELLRALTGQGDAASATGSGAAAPGKKPRLRWRRPVDLTPELTQRLMHGINEQHVDRLKMFAEHDGRVTMKQLLGRTEEDDVRILSHFEGAITRRLRRILGDTEKVAYLIGWDYDSTEWNADKSQIVDGVYYVSDDTLRCLKDYFGLS